MTTNEPTPKPQPTTNWPLIVLVGFGVWFVSTRQNGPGPTPTPVVPVESVVKQVLTVQAKGNADAFALAADKVDSKEIKTDRDLLEFLKPATTKARLDANKPFDVLLETNLPDGSFEGKEAEVSKLLRRVAKSW
jgi:hypothetical protein